MAIISKDRPLAELTLRRYEKPDDLNKRDLVRKFCLSTGLLQPGDSRDVVIDVLHVLLDARRGRDLLSSEDVRDNVVELRKQDNLSMNGVASSNIRRQLKRLRELFIAEKVKNKYRITEFEPLSRTYEDKIERFLLQNIRERVVDYFNKIDEVF